MHPAEQIQFYTTTQKIDKSVALKLELSPYEHYVILIWGS